MRLPVRIVLPCSGLTGYGNFCLGLIKYLSQSRRLFIEWHALNNEIQPSFPQEYRPLIDRISRIRNLGLVIGYPTRIFQSATNKTILYTMYEADDIPHDWKPYLRRAAEIWVPSEYCRLVFGKYHPRVKIVHLGYDHEAFHRKRGNRKNFWPTIGLPVLKDAFVIGTSGVLTPRKGPDILFQAFQRAFPEQLDPPVYLVFKSRGRRIVPEDERVLWIDQDWPIETMARFYRALDLFVLPTRGEGLCCLPQTLVSTGSHETRPIMSIEPGDWVVTHTGARRRVTETFSRQYAGPIITITPRYGLDKIQVTPEHPIMVMQFTHSYKHKTAMSLGKYRIRWKKALDVKPGMDYLVLPRPRHFTNIENIDLGSWLHCRHERELMLDGEERLYLGSVNRCRGSLSRQANYHSMNAKCLLSRDFLRFCGLFIAEGCATEDAVIFSFHSKETDLVDFVTTFVRQTWNLPSRISYSRDKQVTTVRINASLLARAFMGLFGKGAAQKHIPLELLRLPPQKTRYLLQGLWEGDGSTRNAEFSYSTVSPKLATQIQALLLDNGMLSSLKIRDVHTCNIRGKDYACRMSYTVRVKGPYADDFFETIGLARAKGQRAYSLYFRDDDNFYVPIRSSERSDYAGPVFNLEVEGEHSYCIPFAVHNCLPPLEAAACGTPALVTRYSGPCEYIDDKNIIGIEIAGLAPTIKMRATHARWAAPSVEDLTKKLLEWYHNPSRVKMSLGYWNQEAMARRFERELIEASRRIP